MFKFNEKEVFHLLGKMKKISYYKIKWGETNSYSTTPICKPYRGGYGEKQYQRRLCLHGDSNIVGERNMILRFSSWHWAISVKVSMSRVNKWSLCTGGAEESIPLAS